MSETTTATKYLTPAQAAERLGAGTKESTLRKRAQQGIYPCHKEGRRLVFTEEDLDQIVALTARPVGNPFQTTRRKRRTT